MPLARLRVLGNEVRMYASPEILSVDMTVKNRLWTWTYTLLVGLFRGLVSLVRGKSDAVPPTEGKPTIEYRGKSVIHVHADAPESAKELARRASEIVWYHTYDLGYGIVTPGGFDHGPILDKYCLPQSFAGLRVLDVACFDGFWSMEFEKRGADEVVALDINNARELDLPPVVRNKMTEADLDRAMGNGFRLVHEAKNSKVRRVHCNVYDLSPELAGMFDVVHVGDFLLHLQNPMKALANVRKVTRGYALISEIFDPRVERLSEFPLFEFRGGLDDCVWWYYGLDGLEKMILDAGFGSVELVTKFQYGMRGNRPQMWHVVFKARP